MPPRQLSAADAIAMHRMENKEAGMDHDFDIVSEVDSQEGDNYMLMFEDDNDDQDNIMEASSFAFSKNTHDIHSKEVDVTGMTEETMEVTSVIYYATSTEDEDEEDKQSEYSFNSDVKEETQSLAKELRLLDQIFVGSNKDISILPPVSQTNALVLSNLLLNDTSMLTTCTDSRSVMSMQTAPPSTTFASSMFTNVEKTITSGSKLQKSNSIPTVSFSFESIPQDVLLTNGVSDNDSECTAPTSPSSKTEMISYTGKVGKSSRSLVSRRPLPKPKLKIVEEEEEEEEEEKQEESAEQVPETTTVVEPFVMPFMTKMEDGSTLKRSFLPRMVSYYEIKIVAQEEASETIKSAVSTSDEQQDFFSPPSAEELAALSGENVKEQEDTPEADDVVGASNTFDTNPEVEGVVADEETPEPEEDSVQVAPPCIAVGLTSEFHRTDIMPGWGKGNGKNPNIRGNGVLSFGLHSDDGSCWMNRQQLKDYAPNGGGNAICAGDVIGCGVDYRTHTVFYTLNGVFLGHAHAVLGSATALEEDVVDVDFYPTIGIDSNDSIECNFGLHQPFEFDLVQYCSNEPPAFVPQPMTVWKSPQESQEEQEDELRQQQLKALRAKKMAKRKRFSLRRMFSNKRRTE